MKTIYIARHGEAVPIGQGGVYHDFDRFLTETGSAAVSAQAKGFHQLENRLQACFSSPLLRTQQTAEILCKPTNTQIQSLDALGASPDFDKVLSTIFASEAERILLVTHQPFVEHLLSGLLTADHNLSSQFDTGTMACLQMHQLSPDPYGELIWFLPAAVMAQVQSF